MKILIKSAKVIDTNSPFNNQTKDILIIDGIVKEIGDNLSNPEAKEISYDNLHISPGLVDIRCNFRDPGHEQHEDLESGIAAAKRGGFTEVCVMPSSTPCVDNKSMVSQLIKRSQGSGVKIHPIGAVSQNMEGKELSEMFDMKSAGAIAFSDDKKPISNANLLSRALLYTKTFEGLVMSYPNDKSISNKGQMHEGQVSTTLGLEGIPSLAEEIQVSRDLFLANYNDANIHIGPISASNSLSMIKDAKENGIKVTTDIAAHQLWFTDADCSSFDSNLKTNPPLRDKNHQADLVDAIQENIVDIISSDHTPWDEESKVKEFGLAEFGISSLETSFSCALTKLSKITGLEKVIQLMSNNPRTILKLDTPIVKEGFEMNFVLYNPDMEWTFEREHMVSKSKNSPFIGEQFTGKVYETLSNH